MMKTIGLTILVCAIALVGFTDEIDNKPSDSANGLATESLGLTQTALSSCTLRSRSDIIGGVVETLLCDGVACTRTCSSSNATLCSMKCTNTSQPPPVQSLDLGVLRAECRMDPNSRVNAGWAGISQATCEARGGCWDNRTRDPNIPWCFEPLGRQPTCGAQAPAARVNAGSPGISAQNCVLNRGACWDDRVRSVPWCFQPVFSILTPPTPPPTPTPPGPAPGTPMATWRAFTTALDAGDQAAALNMLASGSRPIYQQALGTLGGVSRQLTRNWSAPEQLRSGPEFVTFVIVAQERAGARAHLVTLVQENGQWLIEQF